jgi:hypothetical protein
LEALEFLIKTNLIKIIKTDKSNHKVDSSYYCKCKDLLFLQKNIIFFSKYLCKVIYCKLKLKITLLGLFFKGFIIVVITIKKKKKK